MPLSKLDASLLRTWGIKAQFTPAGGDPEEVLVIKSDPDALAAADVLLVLFGAIPGSGFSQAPVKGDAFTVAGTAYRVYDFQGPDLLGGYHIHLEKQ